MTSNDYQIIRHLVVQSSDAHLGEKGLNDLKNDLHEKINSNRRSSFIKSFEDLISVLEKRGHVGPHSMTLLQTISRKLPDPEISRRISRCEEHLQRHHRAYENQYSINLSHSTSSFHARCSDTSSISPICSESSYSQFSSRQLSNERNVLQIPENVTILICAEIGKQWMELARKLGIREGEIDTINDKYPSDLKSKAREVLLLFTQRTDPMKLQCTLLDGLVQARRRDLKEGVEEIFMRRRY